MAKTSEQKNKSKGQTIKESRKIDLTMFSKTTSTSGEIPRRNPPQSPKTKDKKQGG